MSILEQLASHFFQIAYVVDDVEKAEPLFQRLFGVPSFFRMADVQFGEGCRYRESPADYAAHLSIGYLRDVQIELVEPVRGQSLYSEFLAQKGPGLHHVAFSVPDFDPVVAALDAEGLPRLGDGAMGPGCRFAYFDCPAPGASVVEILGFDEATAAFMNSLKDQAAAASS